MGYFSIIITSTFLTLLAFFVNYPAPDLSDRLLDWKLKGHAYQHETWDVFYLDETGDGPSGTLICLHGFPTMSYDWIRILPDLKREFRRIILLDFLGFGFSSKPIDHTYRIAEQADIVEGLARNLGIKSAHILSHDYGDTVALELVARFNSQEITFHPQSLVMLNGGVFPETHHPRISQKILLTPVIGYFASHLFTYSLFCRGFGEVFGDVKPSPDDNADFWAGIRFNNGDRASYKVINFLRERQAFRDRWVGALQSTKLPVHMIYGPADPVNPPAFAAHFKKMVPTQSIVTLDSYVGHYPQWEAPEAVSSEILSFIQGLPKS